jgi:hypothetical protein
MTETSDPTCLGGRVVFLIDETEALREHIAGGTKTKAESIATALNSLLNQLTAVPDLEAAVAGYRDDGSGADVGCRWAGPLAGRRFVPTSALADAPLAVETRVRRVPAMMAGRHEATVQFPIWYVPRLGEAVFPVLGYGYCRHLVVAGVAPQTAWSQPPLVISFVGGSLSQQVAFAVERVQSQVTPGGRPLVFHIHLGGPEPCRPVLYPSTDVHLPPGAPCDLFRWSSALPEYMIAALRAATLPVSTGGRGMIYNAAVADLIRMLSLVKTYAEQGACSTGFSRNDEGTVPKKIDVVPIPAEAGTTSAAPECPA